MRIPCLCLSRRHFGYSWCPCVGTSVPFLIVGAAIVLLDIWFIISVSDQQQVHHLLERGKNVFGNSWSLKTRPPSTSSARSATSIARLVTSPSTTCSFHQVSPQRRMSGRFRPRSQGHHLGYTLALLFVFYDRILLAHQEQWRINSSSSGTPTSSLTPSGASCRQPHCASGPSSSGKT